MNTTTLFRSLAVLLLGAGTVLTAAASEPDAALIERGRYLVTAIGGCNDCHTPRNQRGEIVPGTELTGSALPFAPTVPMPAWAPVAPAIAGLPGYTTEQGITFLMTGMRPVGTPPRPPMPEFRLNREDAAAVVAYLKSFDRKH